jgi:hypothetical protein
VKQRFGVIDGVNVPVEGYVVMALRRRDSDLLSPLDPQGRPQASLAIKRQTRAFEDSSKASPLVPRRACRNRRGHRSQLFHPLGIGG